MTKIKTLLQLSAEERMSALSAVEEIFFLSTSIKSFSSIEKKSAFYKKWCKDYQAYYPELFFIVFEDQKVLGYLSGCLDSAKSLEVLVVPGQSVFQDLFNDFPAHLHINFHPDARGKGMGSLLVKHYIDFLRFNSIPGVHLVTSPDAPNVSFYDRLGFTHTHIREINGSPLLFMGKILDENRQ